MTVLGFDTSNYTTSVAIFDGASGENQSRLLPVKAGALGLRQAAVSGPSGGVFRGRGLQFHAAGVYEAI